MVKRFAEFPTPRATSAAALYADGPHAIAAIFPRADPIEIQALAADIGQRGLLEAITVRDGKILDGNSRMEACLRAGVEPKFEQFTGTDPIAFVVSKNLRRRHLTTSQRALVAARLADLGVGANQHSQGTPSGVASKALNVSQRSLVRARKIEHHGDAELMRRVEHGELSLGKAVKVIEARASQQDPKPACVAAPLVEDVENELRALREALDRSPELKACLAAASQKARRLFFNEVLRQCA